MKNLLLLALAAAVPSLSLAQGAMTPEQKRLAEQARAQQTAVTELVEERVCVVVVRMKKSEFTFDLEKHLKNWASAVERSMVVSDTTCEKWQIGQELSGRFDTWGFVFDGDLARYTIRVKSKQLVSRYFATMASGATAELPKAQYDARLAEIRRGPSVTVPYSGFIRTTVLPGPVAELKVRARAPIQRHFVLVKVRNNTITLDLEKHVRNAWNTHELTFEVPKAVYDQASKVWDTRLSGWAFVVKGSLSFMTGTITKKWSEADPNYLLVTTEDGKSFVIPAAQLR